MEEAHDPNDVELGPQVKDHHHHHLFAQSQQ